MAAVALLLLARPWPPEAMPEVPDAGAAPELQLEHGVMTDAAELGEEWAGLPVPATPRPDQETRCDADAAEVNINGGCYIATDKRPPCPSRQYEHGGKCWVAVGKRGRPATSIGQ